MILTYLTHKKWMFTEPGIKIIATQSPIAYQDLVGGFKNNNDLLMCSDDDYEEREVNKTFDFVGDPLLSGDVTKKYMLNIVKNYIANIDEASRNKIMAAFQNLEVALEDSLLLEDMPLAIDFTEDLKKLLKMVDLHIDQGALSKPYAIIEVVLKIHQVCNLKTIPVICNATNYLDEHELKELAELVKQMDMVLLLIEFTSSDLLVVPENAQFYYIDRDLIDWY